LSIGMSPADAALWLRSSRPLGQQAPTVRLLCLPYAGGGATIFHAWASGLPAGVEVRAAQLPGRQDRLGEPGLRSVTAIVERLSAALFALPPAPLAIYGHSFGAVLGYELAQRLRATPSAPRALLVGGRRAPHLPARASDIYQLSDSAFKQELHRRYGMSLALLQNTELMQISLPALRADFEAVETYRPGPDAPLDIPLTVLRARQDLSVSTEEAAAWQQWSSQPTVIHELDAGHLFVDTHRAWVLARVADCLKTL
jgi:surfactin synthase thioesterase subunit